MPSSRPRAPAGSAMEKSLSSMWSRSSASVPARPEQTRFEFQLRAGGPATKRSGQMANANSILKLIKEKEIKFVDLRFTDPRGKWQHVTFDLSLVDEDFLTNGTMFDGSSIAGWKAINESDMTLVPDCDTAIIDPFFAQTTLALFCDIIEPTTGQRYARCPRSIAKAAEKFMASSGVGDTAYFGPEAEFFIFDDVRFDSTMNKGFYYIDSAEGAYNSGTEFEGGNLGHRPAVKGGYFPV